VTKISNSASRRGGVYHARDNTQRSITSGDHLDEPAGRTCGRISRPPRGSSPTRAKQALSIPIIALTVRENTPVRTEAQGASRGRRGTGARRGRPPRQRRTGKKKEPRACSCPERQGDLSAGEGGIAGDEYFEVLDGLPRTRPSSPDRIRRSGTCTTGGGEGIAAAGRLRPRQEASYRPGVPHRRHAAPDVIILTQQARARVRHGIRDRARVARRERPDPAQRIRAVMGPSARGSRRS